MVDENSRVSVSVLCGNYKQQTPSGQPCKNSGPPKYHRCVQESAENQLFMTEKLGKRPGAWKNTYKRGVQIPNFLKNEEISPLLHVSVKYENTNLDDDKAESPRIPRGSEMKRTPESNVGQISILRDDR